MQSYMRGGRHIHDTAQAVNQQVLIAKAQIQFYISTWDLWQSSQHCGMHFSKHISFPYPKSYSISAPMY